MNDKKTRKQSILDTALECFNELGLEGCTIDMIRERSGASVGSLYHHFGNKESIGIALHEMALDQHQLHVQDLLADAQDAEAAVRALVSGYIDFVAKSPSLARFLMQSRGFMVRTADVAVAESGLRDRLGGRFREWLAPHIRSGAVRKLPSEVYLSLIIGPAQEYAWNWLAGRSKRDIRTHTRLFSDAAWQAVKGADLPA